MVRLFLFYETQPARKIRFSSVTLVGRTVTTITIRTSLAGPGRSSFSVLTSSRVIPFVAFVTDIRQRRMAERWRSLQFAVTRPLANAATWVEASPQVLQGICEALAWVAGEFWPVDRDANLRRLEIAWHRPLKDVASFEAASRELTLARAPGFSVGCGPPAGLDRSRTSPERNRRTHRWPPGPGSTASSRLPSPTAGRSPT